MKTRIKCVIQVRKWSFKHEVAVSSKALVQEAVLHGRTWQFRRGLHIFRRTGSSEFCTMFLGEEGNFIN